MPRVTVRLACVRHAASVQSEPGSNSTVRSVSLNGIEVNFTSISVSASSKYSKLLRSCSTSSAHAYRLQIVKELRKTNQLLGVCCGALFVCSAQKRDYCSVLKRLSIPSKKFFEVAGLSRVPHPLSSAGQSSPKSRTVSPPPPAPPPSGQVRKQRSPSS
uniref:Uncharacterized protein n=1 Tax=uncultured beta proteobacterium CBNPD1 BAC clone 578 TaxID=417305 RepID=B1N6K2_9PROT|nr:conserved hypothetical protein [uncultured beta proteobacterium CBNPD1 BAC clone 578]